MHIHIYIYIYIRLKHLTRTRHCQQGCSLSLRTPPPASSLTHFVLLTFSTQPGAGRTQGLRARGVWMGTSVFVPKRSKASCSYQVLMLWWEGSAPPLPAWQFPYTAFMRLCHLHGQPSRALLFLSFEAPRSSRRGFALISISLRLCFGCIYIYIYIYIYMYMYIYIVYVYI